MQQVVHCLTKSQVKECFNVIKNNKVVAFDFETTGLSPFVDNVDVWTVAFAVEDTAFAIPLYKGYWSDSFSDNIRSAISKFLIGDYTKIAHNLKFDLLWGLIKCAHYDAPDAVKSLIGTWHDTAYLCWLFDETAGNSALKKAAVRYLKVKPWGIDVTDVRNIELKTLLQYNALDALYTYRLWKLLYERIKKEPNLYNVYNKLLIPATLQFLKCEWYGVPIDNSKYTENKKKVKDIIVKLVNIIHNKTGLTFDDINSPDILINYFKTKKNYEWNKQTTRGKLSMDKSVLQYLVSKYNDETAKLLIDYKHYFKLYNTYLDNLNRLIHKNTIHGNYHLTGTVTGRVSSNSPNMQNFPKKDASFIREMMVAPKDQMLACFDYGQIEARLSGLLTEDVRFCKALFNKYDIHLENAKELFGDAKAKEWRHAVKQATFALLYGAGDFKIAKLLDISQSEARRLRDFLNDKFPKLLNHKHVLQKKLNRYGYLESLFGRRRRQPISFTDMLNYIQQSSASDVTLSALVNLSRRYRLAFMIHDDLSFYINNNELEKSILYIAKAMITIPWVYINKQMVGKYWIPLNVECNIGRDWYNQESLLELDSIECGFDNYDKCVEYGKQCIADLQQYSW